MDGERPEPPCGLAYRTARRAIKDLLREKHIAPWDKSTDFIKLGRNQLRWIVGLFTGHCPLMRHLTTIGVKNDPDCRRCGEEEETSFHILCECPALALSQPNTIRYSNFGAITIELKEGNSVDFLLTNKEITYEIRTEIKRLGRPIPDLIISKTDCVGKG
ncbi:hypothetical protein NQ318_015929 [Aromia moschata]|uniref:Reverse transcriptase zinc-binding domain-containing protein n=1 Tax=Aromia moschata TaxID=1265417 RepID=A0AAV8XT98_9CUCU|nr:hypothetical protein NQ318_015929 [Aromia moschata]